MSMYLLAVASPHLSVSMRNSVSMCLPYSALRKYSYQGRCWPNGCPKQDCIVVPPSSNIMEVKKKKTTIGVKIDLQ